MQNNRIILQISGFISKIKSHLLSYFALWVWIKEFFISVFDHRLRYFVYGLSQPNDWYIQNYYYSKFLPFEKTQIRPSIYKPHIRFHEVHGGLKKRKKIKKTPNTLTVFSTGECVHSSVVPNAKYYEDNCISCVDISLGFDYINEEHYIRFPFWLLQFFPPVKNKDDIARLIKEFNERQYPKTQFCALVAGHDITGIRTKILEQVNTIAPVMCAGSFAHNDSILQTLFNDNKREYLRQFEFNICPENDPYKGYVTEKVFDALVSDCIPIYWGGDRPPEPEVINPNAIILFDPDNSEEALEKIRFLHNDHKAYNNFKKAKKFNDSSVDWIYNTMQDMFMLFQKKAEEKKLYPYGQIYAKQ